MGWEHLAASSHFAGGAVLRLYVHFARAERGQEDATVWWDVSESGETPELIATLRRHAGTQAAYLPLDAPIFSTTKMAVNYLQQVVEHEPAAAFDAFILLPEGHKLY